MINLFDVKNGVIVPTIHCYSIEVLNRIMKVFDEDDEYLKIYQFLYYMTCPNPTNNVFFNVEEDKKEQYIYEKLGCQFSLEDEIILEALEVCNELYTTATKRAYMGLKSMLDRMAKYMETTPITHGRDGNITALVNTAAKFQQIRASFKDAYKDLEQEQENIHVHGKQKLAYDQM